MIDFGIAAIVIFVAYGIVTLVLTFLISEVYYTFSWSDALLVRLAEWTLYLFLAAILLGLNLTIYAWVHIT